MIMTRFDFAITDGEQASHSHNRCYRCNLFKQTTDFSPVGRCGSCDNPRTEHYGHIVASCHPSCSQFVAREAVDNKEEEAER